ncbi:CNKR1 kinase, partial [Anseranas semipalmata]|nr:CNKR1 kinase [Anseranas semipalmata]
GLDAAVQGYPFEAWGLAGADLLGLSVGVLEALGVRRVGHQELLLEAVEQLCALDTELASPSLRTLTEGLRELAQRTQTLVLEGPPGGATPQPPPLTLLACVVDLIGAAKGLFSWLNRYLFSTLNDFSASRDIVLLCAQLVEVLQTVVPDPPPSSCFHPQCQHIVGICESIVGCSPPALLDRRAVLRFPSPENSLKLPALPLPQALAAHGGRILPGDEIVQVNEQVVVGWTRVNLAKKLLEKASGVTLVLKKIPLSPPGSPLSPRQQVPGRTRRGRPAPPWAPRAHRAPSLPPDPAPRSSAPRQPPGLGLRAQSPDGSLGSACAHSVLPSPACIVPNHSSVPIQGSPETGRRPKGVATRLSRRRVSCRDLGRVDCDGWLLKKKDHVGFMAQKWKRCWFVLKGNTLYWYHHPNDEKAAGLINVATYNLESTREQKKKYVFQLSHERYKPFIFAAETLADLSMWVSHLVTAKMKHTVAHQPVPHREEDCYSETEAEDPDDESPRQGCDSLFLTSGESSSAASSPQGSPRPRSPMGFWGCPTLWCPSPRPDPCEEDLESLMQCLKQGGVSLIGRQRFLTQEQCRKSFIRRNKNPHINEKVHAVRALQSTLKAKLEELQALEQLLDDATLTSEKFRRWKEEHQDLYQELQEWWARRQGQG